MQIGFAKDQVFFHKVAINRVCVDFVEVQVVFCRHSQRPGAFFFVKLTFTKSGSLFVKLPSMDYGLISPKVEGFFAKFTSLDRL